MSTTTNTAAKILTLLVSNSDYRDYTIESHEGDITSDDIRWVEELLRQSTSAHKYSSNPYRLEVFNFYSRGFLEPAHQKARENFLNK